MMEVNNQNESVSKFYCSLGCEDMMQRADMKANWAI